MVLDASAIADIDGDGVHVLEELEHDPRGPRRHAAPGHRPRPRARRADRTGHWQRWCAQGRTHESHRGRRWTGSVDLARALEHPLGERTPVR
jgi:hypothetical protein